MKTPSSDLRLSAADHTEFNSRSGSLLERLIFNHRWAVIVGCAIVTSLLGWQCRHLDLTASFEEMLPGRQEYIVNYLAHAAELRGFGNAIRIAVETTDGDIFSPEYLNTLRQINDEVFLLPGVDRPAMKSLWTPATRWSAVTEEGLDGGPVMPGDFDGSPQSLAVVRSNIDRSGELGQLVATDYKSTVLFVPLLEYNNETGKRLDYRELGRGLEQVRAKYQTLHTRVHIVGFAKLIGDLIDGLHQILLFFLVSVAITSIILHAYTRCIRSTLLVVACSVIAVTWELGVITALGVGLDPYSVLVPFLIFAIGMSHGAQKMNGIMQDIGRGTPKLIAARFTFRRLFMAGLTALLCDTVGFAVLMTIHIQVIQKLALIASLGVAALVFTNLILLPVLLSFVGVSPRAAARSLKSEAHGEEGRIMRAFARFTRKPWAIGAIVCALVLAGVSAMVGRHLQVGDIDPGAPELRANTRYNKDNAFMVSHYAASSDVFVVMVTTPQYGCTNYDTLARVSALSSELRQLPGVEATNSLADLSKFAVSGMNEGNPKWYELVRTQSMLNAVTYRASRELFNESCDLLSLIVYLKDHRAQTLERVVEHVDLFARRNDTSTVKFLMAAGSAGIEAATNIVVSRSTLQMLILVYGAVTLLCLVAFRSLRATVAAILPLALTSLMCQALMVMLGIGVKVGTLPVVALGVGIGIDYALYIIAVVIARLRQGDEFTAAVRHARLFTGRVVILTGFALAVAVSSWAWSPIKFQADMGILLAFMFFLNMLGAMILLPAIGRFLIVPSHFHSKRAHPVEHPASAGVDLRPMR
jgi:uncharacterized protein